MFGMGMWEMAVIMGIAVLLFGKRLPEVARSVGKSYHQLRGQLNEFQYDISSSVDLDATPRPTAADHADDLEQPAAPKFRPPPAEDE